MTGDTLTDCLAIDAWRYERAACVDAHGTGITVPIEHESSWFCEQRACLADAGLLVYHPERHLDCGLLSTMDDQDCRADSEDYCEFYVFEPNAHASDPCPGGSECVSDSYCWGGVCLAKKGEAAMCEPGQCQPGLWCADPTGGGDRQCLPSGGPGEACASSWPCAGTPGCQRPCGSGLTCLSVGLLANSCQPPLANGSACLNHSDCAGLACVGGQCRAASALGDPCAWYATEPCPPGSECRAGADGEDRCLVPGSAGEHCEIDGHCLAPLHCIRVETSSGHCGTLLGAGDACGDWYDDDCAAGLLCSFALGGVCAPGTVGEPCFYDSDCYFPYACDASSDTCVLANAALGEPCAGPEVTCWGGWCDAEICVGPSPYGHACDPDTYPSCEGDLHCDPWSRTCRYRSQAGGECTYSFSEPGGPRTGCAAGLVCSWLDQGTCFVPGDTGEACDGFSDETCVEGHYCQEASLTCQPLEGGGSPCASYHECLSGECAPGPGGALVCSDAAPPPLCSP